jgi:hypothetical protein
LLLSLLVHSTRTLYSCTLLIFPTHFPSSYSLLILPTHTPYSQCPAAPMVYGTAMHEAVAVLGASHITTAPSLLQGADTLAIVQHTLRLLYSCTLYSCALYSSSLLMHSTPTLYSSSLLMHSTHPLYTCSLLMHSTHPLYTCSLRVHLARCTLLTAPYSLHLTRGTSCGQRQRQRHLGCMRLDGGSPARQGSALSTHTLYSYSLLILSTHTLYSSSLLILSTHALYSYSHTPRQGSARMGAGKDRVLAARHRHHQRHRTYALYRRHHTYARHP